ARVSFSNLSSPAITGTKYSWDFGDGNTSDKENPEYIYNKAGTYKIRLKITNPAGCTDTISKSVTILKQPDASFTSSDSVSCHRNFTVSFKNTSINGSVVSWNFGDGHDTGAVNIISHTYADTGTYSVTLTVRGTNGCLNTFIKTNHIKIYEPVDSFTASPVEGCVPLKVTFKNFTKSLIPITDWRWDFGDGNISTSKDPGTHIYTKEGRFTAKLMIGNAKGCYDTFSVNIKAGSKPTADFSGTPRKGCISDMKKVAFTNLSKNADSFFWNFDVAGTSKEKDPVMPYDVKEGKYPVTLIAWNKGCKDSITKKDYIEILPPWASFGLQQYKCAPDTIQLKDMSVGGDSIIYYFGDGDTTTKRNPLHVYKKPGSYKVLQIAYNRTTKCIDSFFIDISVEPLTADFYAINTSGCAPLTVNFFNTANKLSDFEWNFGDGNTSTEPDPTYTYLKKGVYDVTLKVTSKYDTCIKFIKKTKFISVIGPTAKFGIKDSSGCVPFKVTLYDSSSTKNIVSKTWDLGNGTIIPVTSQIMEYTYTKPPANQNNGFTITLTLKDSSGCAAIATRKVYPSQPKPNFYAETTAVCGSVNYKFVPYTDGTTGLQPFKYLWNLGESDTSTSISPKKTFLKSGKYLIRLTLTDKNGCTDTISRLYIVNIQFPVAKLSAEPSQANCPPLLVTFKDLSSPGMTGIAKWFWDFGDGTSSELQNPEKIYLRPGHFTVKLTVTDSVGCMDTIRSPNIVIVNGPTGILSFDKDSGCTPLTVNFRVKSKNAMSYTWDMGDGTLYVNSANPTQSHTYTAASMYIPSVTLTDSFGCTFHLPPIDTIMVYPLPEADFSVADLCAGYPTNFTNLSSAGTGKIENWLWDFGDGSFSTDSSPKHIYKVPKTYNVSLTVTNNKGCENKITQSLRMHGLQAKVWLSQPHACLGDPVEFKGQSVSDTSIISRFWDFGDGATSTDRFTEHTYLTKGKYRIFFRATDITGCSDTLTINNFIVGDTAPPPAPVIYRVTVENNNTIELDFQKNRLVDFAAYIIYRENGSGSYKEIARITNPDDTIYFDKTVDALHQVYCYKVRTLNVCGYLSLDTLPSHCNIELTAKPAVNAAVLSWNFYKGWKKVNKYEIYREDIKDPGSFLLINTVDGKTQTYSDSDIICYRTHAYRVKAYEDSGYNQVSWSDTSVTTPIYVPRVPAPYVIRATVENNKEVRLEWTDNPKVKIKSFIVQKSDNGISYSMIDTPFPRTTLWLVDKDVEVNRSSYYYRVLIVDSCGDAGPYSNLGKTILLDVDTTAELLPRLRWSRYKQWPDGVRYYDVEQLQPDGTFMKIGQTQSGDDTVYIDELTNLNSLPDYCYRVIAHRSGPPANPDNFLNITSTSNEACTPVRSVLWIPNVFTPNQDTINDKFYVRGIYIRKFNIKIFDRWGTRVYESNDINEGWDGRFKGAQPLMDGYKYLIVAQGVDGRNFYRQGWVTILR
ncbi:MAG: PKD domain-containing protein, partial [Sphingobacteriales bacterium]